MWEIRRYNADDRKEWDAFVATARNATFLFRRDYMDYHSDRFADCSLLAYRRGKLRAILPANIGGDILYSHQGLTYGGWVYSSHGLDTTEIFLLWRAWLDYCSEQGIRNIIYKPLPYIYFRRPSEEDRYMLFLSGAEKIACSVSSAINLTDNPGFNTLQKRHLKETTGIFYGHLITARTREYVKEFHTLLESCLQQRHSTLPVHTYEELQLLMDRFPDSIVIWGAYAEDEPGMLGGVCVYLTERCVHCQYIATSPQGRQLNILSQLFSEMIERYAAEGWLYFDFGISNEDGGRYLNPGLNRQKTSYGASGVAYETYRINVSGALESLPSELWPPR